MLVVQESTTSNTPQVTYTRGPDLSGTFDGAGGIGGMLARSTAYQTGAGGWSTHQFYHADANGNITYLVTSAQALAASYRYDPFGRTVTSSGTSASANTYRFSSKEIQPSSGHYYYGYRFYDPTSQRWLNRDPFNENGFTLASGLKEFRKVGGETAQYAFVSNNPVMNIDPEGLFVVCYCEYYISWKMNCMRACSCWHSRFGPWSFVNVAPPQMCVLNCRSPFPLTGGGVPEISP
jgi:RHS repeat-associated protein